MLDAPRILDHKLVWPRGLPQKRPRTLGLIVHHSAGNPQTETIEYLHRLHLNISNNDLGIGYNYVIPPDGTIHLGRPEGTIGAHCRGFNSNYAGVCLTGNFDKIKPTSAQLEGCAKLWAWLSQKHGWDLDPDTLTGHRDHPGHQSNHCPGANLHPLLGSIVTRGRHIARGGILEWQGHTLTYGMDAEGDTAIVGVRELAEALGLSVDVTGWPRVVVS